MAASRPEGSRLAMLGAAVLPVAGIAYYTARRFWSADASKAPQRQAGPPPTTPPAEWTTAEVLQWLNSNDAHADVVAAFKENDVDGATLPLLTEQHLTDMGIAKVSHRVKVLRSIRIIFGLPVDTPSMGPTPAPSVAASAVPSATQSPSASLARDRRKAEAKPPVASRHVDPAAAAEESDGDEVITPNAAAEDDQPVTRRDGSSGGGEVSSIAAKIRGWQDILTSDAFKKAAPVQQGEVVREAARELAQIAKILQQLPPSQPVNELKAAATSLMQAIAAANESLSQTAADGDAASAAAGGEEGGGATEGVLRVAELLEQFQQVLTSPDIIKLPADQRASITGGIAEQLTKISENVLEALPLQHQEPLRESIGALLAICEKLNDPELVQQLAAGQQAEQGGASADAATGTAQQERGVDAVGADIIQLLQRFDGALSSKDLAAMPIEQRGEVVKSIATQLISIQKKLIAALPEQQQAKLSPLVVSMLRRCQQLLSQEGPAAAEDRAAPAAEGDDAFAKANIVIELLQRFDSVLSSDDLAAMPLQQRQETVSNIAKELTTTQEKLIVTLPEELQGKLSPLVVRMLRRCQQLLLQEGAAASEGDDGAAQSDRDATPASLKFIVLRLRQVFDEVKSPAFMQESDPEKLREKVAGAARTVHQLAMEGDKLPDEQRAVVRQVAENIMAVLKKVMEAIQAQPAAGGAAAADDEDEGEADGEVERDMPQSKQELEIAQLLSKQLVAMLNVLKSDAFEQASLQERASVARKMAGDLDKMRGHLDQQPAEVRKLLEPTRDKLQQFINAVIESAAEEKEGGDAPSAGTGENAAETAQLLSKQLVAMLNVLKSDAFGQASPQQRAAVATKMAGDLERMGDVLAKQPEEVRQLLEPTRDKLRQFINAVAAPAAQADAEDDEDEDAAEEGGDDSKKDPSPEFLRLNNQMKEIVGIVRSEEFKANEATKQLDVIVQCQQLLSALVQRIEELSGAEHQVAMHNAQQVNQLLKAIADPIVAGAEEADGATDTPDDEDTREAAGDDDGERDLGAGDVQRQEVLAMRVVQRTQALFEKVNAEEFLAASPQERDERAKTMNKELVELAQITGTLDKDTQESIMPLLRSLAGILSKLMSALSEPGAAEAAATAQALGDDEAEDEDEECDGEEAADGEDEGARDPEVEAARQRVYQLAAQRAAAIRSGEHKVTSIESVEELSQLLSLLERCGCRNREEIAIRERYQAAVETALAQLSDALGSGDDDADDDDEELKPVDGEVEERQEPLDDDDDDESGDEEDDEDGDAEESEDPLGEVLETIVSVLDHANSEEQIGRVLPHLSQIAQSGAWRENPKHVDLLARAMKTIETKRKSFAADGTAAPTEDISVVKAELEAINEALPTASGEQLPVLMRRLTDLTDASPIWKGDSHCVALVNNAIRQIQQASIRLSKSGVEEVDEDGAAAGDDDDDDAGEEGETRLEKHLLECASRVRDGADVDQFMSLAAQVGERKAVMTPAEKAALRELEGAIEEALIGSGNGEGERKSVSPDTPAGQRETPPNTPASPQRSFDDDHKKKQAAAAAAAAVPVPRRAGMPAVESDSDDEESESASDDADADGDGDAVAEARQAQTDAEDRIIEVIHQVRDRIDDSDISSFDDLRPYVAFLSKLRDGVTSKRVDVELRKVEDTLRGHIERLKSTAGEYRSKSVELKRRQMMQIIDIVQHPNFRSLDGDVRQSTMRRGTDLLGTLSAEEQDELRNEAGQLIAALEDATKSEDALLDREHQVTAMADLGLLPRILERLREDDFMQGCSAFEVKAIASTLARLDSNAIISDNREFRTIVQQASKLFGERVASYEGEAKSSKAVSCPLRLTGMSSEGTDGHPVVRYTLFSPEEEESYAVNETVAARFARASPEGGEAKLPDGGIDQWRKRSVALLFCFEKNPVDQASTNDTAQSEATMLAELLDEQHGFQVIRCHGEPTPESLTEAVAALQKFEAIERLFIFVMTPPIRNAVTTPPPQHSMVFCNGQHVRHTSIVNMAKEHAKHVVLYHDVGDGAEVLAWDKDSGLSHHLGASVTEAAFLVANASRCWLYDGLATPTLLEALCCDARTLCPEDLVNNLVRTLIAKDGADGPYLTESGASGKAFFAPGLDDDGEEEE